VGAPKARKALFNTDQVSDIYKSKKQKSPSKKTS
jgi:hypothetical protein